MRTFLAVFPPPEVQRSLADLIVRVGRRGDGVSWVKPDNLHYTVRFLGPLDPKRVSAACEAAGEAVDGAAPFELALGETGAFPNFRRPRVLWVGAKEGANELETLARAVQETLRRRGFGPPDKPFRAHLTVGRVRDPRAALEVLDRFDRERPDGRFRVEKLVVVESTLQRGGSVYRPHWEAPLGPRRASGTPNGGQTESGA